MRRLLAAGLLAAALGTAGWGMEAEDPAISRELEAIRDQVVALKIEAALVALDALLERSGLTDAQRVAAYDLRAQAHAASDDLKSVESDYRAILALDAAYAPRRETVSKKALDRFTKLQAAMIGTVHLDLEPKDAAVTVDERPVAPSPDGSFPAVAGERRLHLTRSGFDPSDATVHVVAGTETLTKIRLVPNARGLVVRTDIPDVAVSLDGAPVGATVPAAGGGDGATASFSIADVPIGEHQIGLSKPCYATETLEELVTVDLADRSPKLLRVVAMRPDHVHVAVTGAAYRGELRVDGAPAGTLPLTSFSACPGARAVEVLASGRVVWSGRFVADPMSATLDLAPRPNAVLVGAAWPEAWREVAAGWSLKERIDLPAGVDLTSVAGWERVALPPGTDLALAVLPAAGLVGDERTVVYGPALRELDDAASPRGAARPPWRQASIAGALADEGGRVVLVSVTPGGPAAKAGLLAGDRVVSVNGRPATRAAAARQAIAESPIGGSIALEVGSPAGDVRRVTCVTVAEPRAPASPSDRTGRVVRAAWAAADAAADGPDAAVALVNLAMLLEQAGRDQAALEAWRRVRTAGDGGLAARAAYAIGAGLQSAGKRAEAIEAFREARSGALAHAEPILAAAAGDRLADLGVTPR